MLSVDGYPSPLEAENLLGELVYDPPPSAEVALPDEAVSLTVDLGYARAVANRFIVRYADEITPAAAFGSEDKPDGTVIRELPMINGAVVEFGGGDVLAAAAQWSAHPSVIYAEPDYLVHTLETFPNDPTFSDLWGMHNTGQTGGTPDADIDAPEAWDLFSGSSSVVIASIDTGIDYRHEDLAANVWKNTAEYAGLPGVDDDGNGYVDDVYGIDAYNGDSDPFDDRDHGTHTAGTMGAVGGNATGVAGVNWDTKVMALKFLGAGGSGSTSGAIECIEYMTMMKTTYGVNVVVSNNSWGGGGYSQSLKDAIEQSNEAGIMFVAAAGNDDYDNDSYPHYPSSYDLPGIIAVAATDDDDQAASFTSYGATSVDLGAPGVSILSTVPGGGYGLKNGTSMASPHVAGAAALAMAFDPAATLAEVKAAILAGVDPLPALDPSGPTAVLSGGRLNLSGTLDQLGFFVFASSPAEGEVIYDQRSDFEIHFSEPYDPTTVDAADLTVNAVAADSVIQTDPRTLTFHYLSSPVTADGVQAMEIAVGTLARDRDGEPVRAGQTTFRYDSLPMQVDATVPVDGSLVVMPFSTLQVDLNEAFDPASVGTDDVILSQGTVVAATPVDADTVEYRLEGIAIEELLTIEMPAGVLTDGYGNPSLPYAGSLVLDYSTVPWPVPLEATDPPGSLIYDANVPGMISFVGDIDSFTIDLDHSQTITVLVEADGSLQPAVSLFDSSGLIGGPASAGAAGEPAVIQVVATTGGGPYTIIVGGANNTTGSYTTGLILNAAVEMEEHGGPANNDPASAEDLDASFIALDSGVVGRGAVFSTEPADAGTVLYREDFESGVLGAQWTTYSSELEGRIRVTGAQGTAAGSYALLMDRDPLGPFNLNEAIWTVDLSGVTEATLSFAHAGWRDEFHRFDGDFADHYNADGVAISDDGTNWHPVWDPTADPGGTWRQYSVDLGAEAAAAGITLGPDFRVKFQQYDNHPLVVDGRGYDEIAIIRLSPSEVDWYRFTLGSGQSTTLALTAQSSPSPLTLELYDGGWNLLARAVAADNVDQAINDFVVPSTDTYYARVEGRATDYSLVVTRDTGFDAEPNNDLPDARDVTTSGRVLGHVGPASEPLYYVWDWAAASLFTVDLEGTVIHLGPAGGGAGNISGLAYDTADEIMYASSISGSSSTALWTLDLETGAATYLGMLPRRIGAGLTYSPLDGLLYGGSYPFSNLLGWAGEGTLVQIDPGALSVETVSGPGPGTVPGGLAFNPLDERIYAHSNGSPRVFSYDAVTFSGPVMHADPDSGPHYGMTHNGTDLILGPGSSFDEANRNLFTYDPASGVTTPLYPAGHLNGFGFDAVEFVDWRMRDDFYGVAVNAGDLLVVGAGIPMEGPGRLDNNLDPAVELFDPTGAPVAYSATGPLVHAAVMTGTYTVRVWAENGTQGEYLLQMKGHTGVMPLEVVGTDPADGARFPVAPTQFAVHFSDIVLQTSLQASDLRVDGNPAASLVGTPDGDSVIFDLTALALSEGWHTVSIAAGAIVDVQGTPNEAYAGQFYFDLAAPWVTSSSLQDGDVVSSGDLVYTVQFDDELDATNLDPGDVSLEGDFSGTHVPTLFDYDAGTSTLTLQFEGLPDDGYELTLTSGDGAFEDLVGRDLDGEPAAWPIPPNTSGDGTPGGDFELAFIADAVVASYPLPLAAKDPLGSLIYDRSTSGRIGLVGDTDSYTIDVDEGQAITVVVEPGTTLQPTVQLSDSGGLIGGPVTAGAAGEAAVLQTAATTGAGTYTLTVGGANDTTGAHTVRVILNAAVEMEEHNGPANYEAASAQDLDAGFIALGSGSARRGAVLGTGDGDSDEFFESQTQYDSVYSPNVLSFDFAGVPPALGDATLTLSAIADLNSTGEFLTLDAEGLFSADLFVDGGEQMRAVSTVVAISAADLVALAADGTISFTVTPSQYVDDLDPSELTLELSFTIGPPPVDFYSFTLTAGESSTLALTARDPGTFTLELYDSGLNLLALAVEADNADQVIRNFLAASSQTYFARVAGSATDYSLVVTRNTDFDTEPNDGVAADAQDITPGGRVLGHVGPDDYYSIELSAGDSLVVGTTIPMEGPGEPDNGLDLAVELFDPAGALVMPGPTGSLAFTAGAPGPYTVRVLAENDTQGEYLLEVSGQTGPLPPFRVIGTDPVDGEPLSAGPTEFTVHFSDTVLATSLDPGDLMVGPSAPTAVRLLDGDTVVFDLPGVLPEGWHTVSIGAGAIVDVQGKPIEAYSGQIYIDLTAPRVTASSVQEGEVVPAGDLVYTVHFDEELDAANLEPDDVQLVGLFSGPHAPATLHYDAGTSLLTLYFQDLPDDAYTLTLSSGDGAFEDLVGWDLDGSPSFPLPSGDGAAGGDFAVSFSADVDVTPYPLPPVAQDPLGSLIYDASVSAKINFAGDTDSFTIDVDDGQTIAVVVDPGATLQPTVELSDSGGLIGGPVTAGAIGEDAVIQTIATTGAGTYTVALSGANNTTGAYTAHVILNAAVDMEGHNGPANYDAASAQDINSSFIALGGGSAQRGAVVSAGESGDLNTITFQHGLDGYSGGTDTELHGAFRDVPGGDNGPTNGEIEWDASDREEEQFALLRFDDIFGPDGIPIGAAVASATLSYHIDNVGDPADVYDVLVDWDNATTTYNSFGSRAGVQAGEDYSTANRMGPALADVDEAFLDVDVTASLAAWARDPSLNKGWIFVPTGSDGVDVDCNHNTDRPEYRPVLSVEYFIGPAPWGYYRFDLAAGESSTLALTALTPGNLTLELYDDSLNLLALSVEADNVDQAINNFVPPSTGTYYARVESGATDYSLVVTRNADFETGPKHGMPVARDITSSGNVLGHVAGSLERLFAYDATAEMIREVDPLTGAVLNSFASPVSEASGPDLGLATTPTSLLIAGSSGDIVLEVNPDTGEVTRTLANPNVSVSGMAFLNYEIFLLTDSPSGQITVLDYDTGAVVRIFSTTPGGVSEGLAASADRLLGVSGTTLYEIDPWTGATTAVGPLSNATSSSEGVGVIGDELFIADYSEIDVYDLTTLSFIRALSGLNDLEAIGADGGGGAADAYSFQVTAGDALEIRSSTPAGEPDEPYQFENLLDPVIELYDPTGALVASDSNGAADGRNASLTHTAAATGTYTAQVLAQNGTRGEYLLEVTGHTGSLPLLEVVGTDPVEGEHLPVALPTLTVDFSDTVLVSSLDPSDLTVGGVAAAAASPVDGDTVAFTPAGPLAEGWHTAQIEAGAIEDIQGTSIEPYAWQFFVDLSGPRVISSSVQEGDVVPVGSLIYTVEFDEELIGTYLESSNVELVGLFSGPHVPTVFTYDARTSTLTLEFEDLADDAYTLTLSSRNGAFEDLLGWDLDGSPSSPLPSGDGTPGGDFVAHFTADVDVASYSVPPAPKAPSGGLIYDASVSATIDFAGDTDGFTIDVDDGQTITVVIEPGATFQPTVELSDSGGLIGGPVAAAAAGGHAVIQTIATTGAGTYMLTVGGANGVTGPYTARVILNAAVEMEAHDGPANNDAASAQDIDASFIALGGGSGQRGAVLGTGDLGSDFLESQTQYDNAYYANVLTFDFVGTPPTLGDGTLRVSAVADLGGTSEYLSLSAEGIPFGDLFVDDGGEMEPASTVVSIPMADWVALAADGTISFTVTPSANVDNRGPTELTLDLQFPVAPPTADFYSFNLSAGESSTLALTALTPGELTLELYDGSSNFLGRGVGADNVDQVIHNFLAASTETYYARVAGTGKDYSLVVTRNADFDTEPNDDLTDAQDITPAGTALGHLGWQGLERLFAYDSTHDEIREIDPVTGVVLNSFASPVAEGGADFGLATTPTSLLIAGSSADDVVEVDPDTAAVIRTLPNPGVNVSGIAFLNGEIFLLTDSPRGQITVLDYRTGFVARTFTTSPATVSEGLGASSERLLGTAVTVSYQTRPLALYEIDPLTGATTAVGPLPNAASQSDGVGVIDDELFIADGREIDVYDLETMGFLRTLGGLNNLEAIGADGRGPVEQIDSYSFRVNLGDPLVIVTNTPAGEPDQSYQFENLLDPMIELYDPTGALVAFDANGAPDGRNAWLTHTAAARGAYTVRVMAENGTAGEYVLEVSGYTGVLIFIDDGDPGFSNSAGWTPAAVGYHGDSLSAPSGGGSELASWTFTLPPGYMYEFAATWETDPSLATNARYKFTDGANEWYLWRNQRRAPDDFNDAGVDWESLGTVTCTSGTMVVEVSDLANGVVMADAIRAEQVGTGATFIDNGDPGYVEVGPWGSQPGLYFNQDTAGINPLAPGNGTGANTASWTFDVDPGYVYELAANWLHFTNRATNARYKLRDQVGAVVENEWWKFVGQRNAPNQFDDQGEDWRVLDTFSMTGDTLVVELSDLADGWVLADAMRLVKLHPVDVQFIDDEDPTRYVENPPASWTDGNDPLAGYKDDVHYLPGTSGNTATWTFTVDVGSTYEVAATWYMFGNRASNAPYTVTNGANTWNLTVDQTQGLGDGDFTDQGEEWFVLTDVGAIDTTLEVELTATGDGLVFADAIRLMKKDLAVEVTETDGSTLVSEDVLDLADTYEVVLTAAPTDNVQIDLTTADGQTTAVDNANQTNAFLTFTPADWSVPQTVLVTAVNDAVDEDSHTGLITHSATSLDSRYSGIGIDSVTTRIVDNDVTFDQVIDNGDPVFFEKLGRGWPTASQGYDGDSTFSGAGGGFDTATWTFTVQPGFFYDVSANWLAYSNRATNAPYTLTAGAVTVFSAMDQQVAPDDFTYNTFDFETVGTLGVPLGTHILTVHLTDLANGLVIADAIHISKGAAIVPPPPAAPPADDPVALSDLDPLARWIVASQDDASSDDGDGEEADFAVSDYLFKLMA